VAATRGARLVAVVDRDAARAEAVARKFGAEPVAEFGDAMARPGVDAVVVATPHADHAAQAAAALEAGKHVLVEKPLAVEPDDARRLALRADELRLRLATGLNHRFYPPVADALGLVEGGAIGRVETVAAEIGHRAGAGFLAGWHTEVGRSGGGTLMDNGPHACDLIRRLLGEVVAAKGYLRRRPDLPRGCEVEAFALFRDFDRGFGLLRSSWAQPSGYLGLDVRGSDGSLRVETAPWRLAGVLATGQKVRRGYLAERVAERAFRARFGCERSLAREVAAFVAALRGPVRAGATGWDGCRVAEMVDAVYRADATGAEVTLDLPLVHLPSTARRRALGGRAA
jgi:predicted dehydrogenase